MAILDEDFALRRRAERLAQSGAYPSAEAAMDAERRAREERAERGLQLLREAASRADPEKVARMMAHVDAQVALLPPSHR